LIVMAFAPAAALCGWDIEEPRASAKTAGACSSPGLESASGETDHIAMSDADAFLSGRLLVAMPNIGDPRFERAVIFLCVHNPEHAMGLAVNRPVDGLSVPNLLKRLGVKSSIQAPEDLVLMGGPVERDRGFVLHTNDYNCPQSSLAVTPGISLTATREVLEAVAGHNSRPRRSVMALGYAGWGAGQLEREIRDNTWLVCEPDEALVFGRDHEHKWSQALAKLGISAENLSSTAGQA
jgi:putative transcriptional regulator